MKEGSITKTETGVNSKGSYGEEKIKITQAQKSIEQSTIWNKVRPLFIRGAIATEIAAATGFSRKQVNNSIHRRIKRTGSRIMIGEEFFSSQKTKERMSRVHMGKRKRIVDRPPPTEEERKSIGFVRNANEMGFFTDDLTDWGKLNNLYRTFGRKLPESFYDRFRLEVFLSAIEQAKRGEIELLNKYVEMGRSIGLEWLNLLAQEEGFVKAKLLTVWADGEDEKGFYKFGDGSKIRHIESVDGEFVNDSSMLAIKKLIRKGVIKRIGNDNKEWEDWLDE